MTSAVSIRCLPSSSKMLTQESFCVVGRCFHCPWMSVADSREESSIWSNYSLGTSPEGQGCPRGCRVQQEPRGQLMWALLYNIQLFWCLQTPELLNKTLVGGKRQQQLRLSQLRHLGVPISCKRESHLCPLSSKPCLPPFSDPKAFIVVAILTPPQNLPFLLL